jgi:DNA polymerase/3'-5' exonuclease PolX
MKNALVSELFDQMADIMEILGEDRFRINTYRKVARLIGDMPTDIEMLLAAGKLAETPGIGKSSLVPFPVSEFRRIHMFRPLSYEYDDTLSNFPS